MDDGTNLTILTSISELAVHSVALFQTGNDLSLVEECTWLATLLFSCTALSVQEVKQEC